MGILDKMKAAAGVGNATLQVDVTQRPTKRGENVAALLRGIGG